MFGRTSSGVLMLVIAAVLAACKPPARKVVPGQLLQTTYDALTAGQADKARTAIEDQPIVEPAFLDRTDPRYCTEKGIGERLRNTERQMADELVKVWGRDPVTRYAVVRRDFENEITAEDKLFELLNPCTTSLSELTMAYSRVRTPLGAAARAVLTDLEGIASKSAGPDLKARSRAALSAYERGERADFAKTCATYRAMQVDPTEDPSRNHGRDLILSGCRQSGL
jgi:hypothetical protein